MAKRKAKRNVRKGVVKLGPGVSIDPEFQGLPLINAIMATQAKHNVPGRVRRAKRNKGLSAWLGDEVVDSWIELMRAEGEWVGPQGIEPNTSASELLEAYGMQAGCNREEEGDRGERLIGVTDAIERVRIITEDNHCWGEWLGGLMACVMSWPEGDRAKVRVALVKAIRVAEQSGVDH